MFAIRKTAPEPFPRDAAKAVPHWLRAPRLRQPDPDHHPDFEGALRSLAARARAENCRIERVLIASGHAEETRFYRHLAAYLDLPFFPFPVPIAKNINPRDALSAGLAPVDEHTKPHDVPTFIYAPQGLSLTWIAEQAQATLRMPNAQIAITTPTRFCSSVRATFGTEMARSASTRLYRAAKQFTAQTVTKPVWIGLLGSYLALILVSLFWSAKMWHIALLLVTCFPILPGLSIKFMALRNMRFGDLAAALIADRDLPTYTVLVPIYREAAVLPQLIASLSGLDYPKSKLDIKLLIETDDLETLAAFESIVLPAYFDVVICPRGAPRTKPRALTIGLAYTTSELVVVYDAEDRPDADQLKKAASIFAYADDRLACLQARLTIDNLDDSWLTQQFALEYAALFDVLLPGLAHLDQPIPLGGTSNHFRRKALVAVGAWDPWNVTEDADLGMRLYRAGYRVKTFDSSTHEEAPSHFRAWFDQRTRWLKGWMQTAAVHLRPHRGMTDKMNAAQRGMLILATSLSPVSILFHPTVLFVLNFIIDRWNGPLSPDLSNNVINGCFVVMYMASFVIDAMITARGAAERGINLTIGGLLGIIPYSHLKTLAAWRGLFELLHAPYLWRKTDHGLARTSRLDHQ